MTGQVTPADERMLQRWSWTARAQDRAERLRASALELGMAEDEADHFYLDVFQKHYNDLETVEGRHSVRLPWWRSDIATVGMACTAMNAAVGIVLVVWG